MTNGPGSQSGAVYILEQSPVPDLIYLSSASVYSASEEEVTETTPPAPKTTYGLAEYQGERMLARLAELSLFDGRSFADQLREFQQHFSFR
jgi:nucleoside-diphosphate-sugar epimerase